MRRRAREDAWRQAITRQHAALAATFRPMLKRDLKRETARLRSILERTLLLVSATAGGTLGGLACSNAGSGGSAPDAEAPVDATSPDTSVPGLDAGDSAEVSPWPPGCEPPPAVEYDAAADAPNCEYRVTLPCGLPPFVTSIYPPNCAMPLATCLQICTGAAFPFLDCQVSNGFGCDDDAEAFVAPDGAPIVVQCDKCTITGRRPPGLARTRRPRAGDAVGDFFAGASHLEAASVLAFEILGDELRRLGAPAELVRAAGRSARDEIRHARMTARIARRRGAEPVEARVKRRRARLPVAIAVENAVEGCVRETFGALVAAWQAAHAADREIARTMARIAADETRHAALAWAIAGWLEPRLGKAAKRTVLAARRRAVESLRRELRTPVDAELAAQAGLPTAACAAQMLEGLRSALW